MKRPVSLPLFALAVGSIAVSSASLAKGNCDLESIRAITPKGAVVDTVTPVATPIAHCEVVGHTITQNPGPNRVEWTVMLPDEGFKNRYYFIGQGGAAGVVPTTRAMEVDFDAVYGPSYAGTEVQKESQKQIMTMVASSFAGLAVRRMAEGYAVAGSDLGHKGFMWDFMIDNPAAKFDHGHRGAHVSAVATQAITRAYWIKNSTATTWVAPVAAEWAPWRPSITRKTMMVSSPQPGLARATPCGFPGSFSIWWKNPSAGFRRPSWPFSSAR